MSVAAQERDQVRIARVEEHLRCENRHDLEAVMHTFGDHAGYDDAPWGDVRTDHAGVRAYYVDMMTTLPDLSIEVRHRHVAASAIVLEVTIRGTHLGRWRGLPATGRPVEFPLCAVYTFDDRDLLDSERIYYDRASVLRQVGMFHEPVRGMGRVLTALSHPWTLARAYLRRKPSATTRPTPPATG